MLSRVLAMSPDQPVRSCWKAPLGSLRRLFHSSSSAVPWIFFPFWNSISPLFACFPSSDPVPFNNLQHASAQSMIRILSILMGGVPPPRRSNRPTCSCALCIPIASRDVSIPTSSLPATLMNSPQCRKQKAYSSSKPLDQHLQKP